ncbi:MAG: cupin domain-containing protein [Chloroflexota bacterium]
MPFVTLDSIPARQIVPGFHGRFVHSEHLTFSNWEVEAGAALPEHAHPHEQFTQLLEGEFEFTLEGETLVLKPGMVVVIPANARHAGKAITPCKIMDVFYPVREDYKT